MRSDRTYHDTATSRVTICSEESDNVLHVVHIMTRSTHQLSTRYRPPADPLVAALAEAQRWVLSNRPDAVARQREERETTAERVRAGHRQMFEALQGDALAYISSYSATLSPTEVGRTLELGSARRLNQHLAAWGLQRREHDAYVPIDPTHAEQVGIYGTLRWRSPGLKAIWDAALRHGAATGGNAEFVGRVRRHTDWFDGISEGSDR